MGEGLDFQGQEVKIISLAEKVVVKIQLTLNYFGCNLILYKWLMHI
ncbi:hypothetical protein S2091_2975 [Solimicrobium silvestre]|uniref:Uncharacterized protein n=1 Tax=Solimicrobium silvestre TaxID=2099400 RepID=A0A2S9GXC9_9BURK|nr:hypothetical protein S2091_2975 [Solimicrobium silvestre]